MVKWECEGIGWGELTIVQFENGQIKLDTEHMSMEFVDTIINKAKKLSEDAEARIAKFYYRKPS